jgi:hypothetical protein
LKYDSNGPDKPSSIAESAGNVEKRMAYGHYLKYADKPFPSQLNTKMAQRFQD